MAAGLVQIPMTDGNGVSRNMTFWSDSGTITGNLYPAPVEQGGQVIGSTFGRSSRTAVGLSNSIGVSGATASFATNQMTVTAAGSQNFAVGDIITATGVANGTYITAGSGTGPFTLSTSPGTISAEAVSSVRPYPAGTVIAPVGANGVITFANVFDAALSGQLMAITIKTKSVQAASYKLYLFSQNPTNGSYLGQATPVFNLADLPYLLGVYSVGSVDNGLGLMTINESIGIGDQLVSASSGLYGILVSMGQPTYATTTDVSVELRIAKD